MMTILMPSSSASNSAQRFINVAFSVALTMAPAFLDAATFENKTSQWCGQESVGGVTTASFGDFNEDGFVDLATDESGWTNIEGKRFEAGGPSGCIAYGDINNDGHLDYALVRTPGLHQLGDGKGGFTQGVGPPGPFGEQCMAASWGDINNDGLLDIYYGGGSGNRDTLWRQGPGLAIVARYAYRGGAFCQHGDVAPIYWTEEQDGKGTCFSFKEIRREAGVIHIHDNTRDMTIRIPLEGGLSEWSTDGQASWKQLYDMELQPGDSKETESDQDKWSLAFSAAGAYCRGATGCDFDEDNDTDFYISNYWLTPNWLIVSDGNWELSNHAGELNAQGGAGHSLGACWGDVDNDGYFDLFVGNFAHPWGDQPHSRFLRNLGPGKGFHFEDKGECGIHYQESYASSTLGDYDNDGDLDLYFTTVYGTASYGVKNYPALYRNDGDWHFTDVTEEAGLAQLTPTYQAAWGDVNNDGHLDLVTAGQLFINTGNDNHWLKIRLKGNGETVNTAAIGARLRVKVGGKTLTRQVEGGGIGQGNQNDLTLHFGLGGQADKVKFEIIWTDGTRQTGETRVDCMIHVSQK